MELTTKELTTLIYVLKEEIETCKDEEVTKAYTPILLKLEEMNGTSLTPEIETDVLIKDNELVPSIQSELVRFELYAKSIKNAEDNLKQQIKDEMEKQQIIKIDTPELIINYIQSTYSERFDGKAFKADDEATYNKYVKITPVKASIKLTIK